MVRTQKTIINYSEVGVYVTALAVTGAFIIVTHANVLTPTLISGPQFPE